MGSISITNWISLGALDIAMVRTIKRLSGSGSAVMQDDMVAVFAAQFGQRWWSWAEHAGIDALQGARGLQTSRKGIGKRFGSHLFGATNNDATQVTVGRITKLLAFLELFTGEVQKSCLPAAMIAGCSGV